MKTPDQLRSTIGAKIWVVSDADIYAIQSDARADLLEQNRKMREILTVILPEGGRCHCGGKNCTFCDAIENWHQLKKEMGV